MSLNKWTYVKANPVNLTDPTGKYPIHCQSMSTKASYEKCVLDYYDLEPLDPNNLGATVKGARGCYDGPNAYRAPGYIEGFNFSWGLYRVYNKSVGMEMVYDFATWQRAVFKYGGYGVVDALAHFSDNQYVGIVQGFKVSVETYEDTLTTYNILDDYSGISDAKTLGLSYDGPLTAGVGYGWSRSRSDPLIRTKTVYLGATFGEDDVRILDGSQFKPDYSIFRYMNSNADRYLLPGGVVDTGRLINDMSKDTWALGAILFGPARAAAVPFALKYKDAYTAIRFQEILGW